ncbi:hypothetical protein THAOC_19196, partial [Thalassiosira oceanica]
MVVVRRCRPRHHGRGRGRRDRRRRGESGHVPVLPPLLYQLLAPEVVLAVDALALVTAEYARAVALAVLLEAEGVLALARAARDGPVERPGLLGDGVRDGLVPYVLEHGGVVTVDALAVRAAHALGLEALAVELEALGLLAGARLE